MEALLTAAWILGGLLVAPIFLMMVLAAFTTTIGGDLMLDPYSGNKIRRTENERESDIVSPQAQNPLHVDENGLPVWWNDAKRTRGDIDGDR